MYFQGKKYNLPLTIWLLEGYPRAPPRVYLTPTSDMIIKSNHRFVDASGCVRSPYLDQWSYPASNLRDLTTTLCIRFGEDPPLYAKPPNWRPGASRPPLTSPLSPSGSLGTADSISLFDAWFSQTVTLVSRLTLRGLALVLTLTALRPLRGIPGPFTGTIPW